MAENAICGAAGHATGHNTADVQLTPCKHKLTHKEAAYESA